MNSGHNSDQQRYTNAGEQAAQFIGEFMSIANDFSRRFGDSFSESNPANEPSNDDPSRESRGRTCNTRSKTTDSADGGTANHTTHSAAEGFQQAGEYLREMREAAGYSIDGFAKAMNRQNAVTKIESVEAGREEFPNDWLDQISALLKQNDPMEFFDKLRSLYDVEQSAEESPDNVHGANDQEQSHHTSRPVSAVASKRREKLNEIFTDDTLEGLSESQFEELSEFIKTNYHAALQLVGKKSHD